MAIRAIILSLLLLSAGGAAHVLSADRVMSPGIPDLEQIPHSLPGWTSEGHTLSESVETVYGADTYSMRLYTREDGAAVWVFVAYFRDQQVGAQIHSPKNCVPGGGWTVHEVVPLELSLGDAVRHGQRMILDRQGSRQELVYWFQTRSGSLSNEYALKWDLMKNALRRRPTDAAFVRYHAGEASLPAMQELMIALEIPITQALREVGLP